MKSPSFNFLSAPWLGYEGRGVELFLVCILGFTGLGLLTNSPGLWSSPMTADIAYQGYSRYIALPFLIAAILKGVGLWLNITGRPYSRTFRGAGAFFALWIWLWYAIKFVILMVFLPSSDEMPFEMTLAQWIALATVITGFLFSIRIIMLVRSDLPMPGVPRF